MDYNFARREEKAREMGTIYMALDAVTKHIAEWLDKNLKTLDSDYWNRYVMMALFPAQQETVKANGARTLFDLDQPTILSIFLRNKAVLVQKLGVDPQLFGYAHSIKDIRNKYFHKNSKPLPQKRFKHDVETIVLFLEGLDAGQEIIKAVREELGWKEQQEGDGRMFVEQVKMMPHATSSDVASTIPVRQPPAKKTEAIAKSMGEQDIRKPSSFSFDTKGYPQIIQDRLNARRIVGFRVETLFEKDARSLYDKCKASDSGYDLAIVHFAVQAKRELESTDSILDVKMKLDRGFVGLIPGFQKAIVNPTGDSLVWFFGCKEERSLAADMRPVKLAPPPISGQILIPQWFQHTIHADELPYLSVGEVQTTIELSQPDVDRYAKTYSPRSFAEGIHTGKMLPEAFLQKISNAGNFSMLDIGCGTAALSLGVIHGLDRIIDKKAACAVKLDLVDGNPWMLSKARDFVSARMTTRTNGIPLIAAEYFERKISKVSDCFPNPSYDLIVTSKFLGELVCRGMKEVFNELIRETVRHMSTGGQLLIVDIPKHRCLIESVVKGLPRNIGRVSVRDIEVQPTFMGSESSDSEIVVSVLMSK